MNAGARGAHPMARPCAGRAHGSNARLDILSMRELGVRLGDGSFSDSSEQAMARALFRHGGD